MSPKWAMSLQDIRDAHPCSEGWTKLLVSLGYSNGKYDPKRTVTLGDVARSNGPADALWCSRCLPETEEVRRDLIRAVLPAVKRAAKHTTDQRVHDCVTAIEKWLAGESVDLLEAARAAEAAAWAAEAAAWAAWAAEAAEAAAWAAWAAEAAEAAAEAAWAAWAAEAAEAAAEAAWAAEAARAAEAAAEAAARAARAAEVSLQVEDIVAVFGTCNGE